MLQPQTPPWREQQPRWFVVHDGEQVPSQHSTRPLHGSAGGEGGEGRGDGGSGMNGLAGVRLGGEALPVEVNVGLMTPCAVAVWGGAVATGGAVAVSRACLAGSDETALEPAQTMHVTHPVTPAKTSTAMTNAAINSGCGPFLRGAS